MEWFWEVLGIEPTEEVYQIKKAYVERKRELKRLEAKGDISLKKYEELDNAEKMAIAYVDNKMNEAYRVSELNEQTIVTKAEEGNNEKEKQDDVTETGYEELEELDIVEEMTSLNEWPDPTEEKGQDSESINEIEDILENKIEQKQENSDYTLTEVHHLLEDWSRRSKLSHWEEIFDESDEWSRSNFLKIQSQMDEILKEQLIYLPKNILEYIVEQLFLDDLEKGKGPNWSRKVDNMPDFSFELIEEVPKNQAYLYFGNRFKLYSLVTASDWKTKSFEINDLIDFFEDKDDIFLFSPVEIDQDVVNLLAIYTIKENIKEITSRNANSLFLEEYLLHYESDLSQEKNKTARFLRIIFKSIDEKNISLEDSLYIENSKNSYVEDNLREFLIGCAFYHAKNHIKAEKHFKRTTGEYAMAVKSMATPRVVGKKTVKTQGKSKGKKKRAIDLGTIIKWIIILVVIIQLLKAVFGAGSNFFDDENYFEDGTEEIDIEYESIDFAYETDILTNKFILYFLAKGNHEDEQIEFIDEYVAAEGEDLFTDYQEKYDDIVRKDEEYNFEVVMTEKCIEENIVVVNKTDSPNEQLLLYFDEDLKIVNVVGKNWQELPQKEFLKRIEALYMKPSETVKAFVQEFLMKDSEERAETLPNNHFYFSKLMNEELDELRDIEVYSDLEGGSCYFTQEKDLGYQVVITKEDDVPVMMLDVDKFGIMWFVSVPEGENKDGWQGFQTKETMKAIKELAEEKININEL